MQDRINTTFDLDGVPYHFSMTNHLNDRTQFGIQHALGIISHFIHDNFDQPITFQLGNMFYIPIMPLGFTAELYHLLDQDSHDNPNNYLTFFQRDDGNIQINHFGPFGQETSRDIQKRKSDIDEIQRKRLEAQQLQKKRIQSQKKYQEITSDKNKFSSQFPQLAKKKQLLENLQKLQERQRQLNQNQKTSLEALRLAIQASKVVAEEIAKISAKQSGKIAAKKIPVVGLIAGIGFGAFRAFQGDWTGAAGEVASGAASTVPGPGTALSALIDAGLLAKDIIEQKNKTDKQLQIANKNKLDIESDLKTVQDQIEKIKKQIDVLDSKIFAQSKIVQDLKNEIQSLDNEIKILKLEISKQEDKNLISMFAQLSFIHHDSFSFASDQQFIENIKEFKKIIDPEEKQMTAVEADKNQAIAIIIAFIIPSGYDKKGNLSDLLTSANLTKEEVKQILETLPKIQNNFLTANSEAIFENQVFLIQEKQNGQKAICTKYGMKIYLSATQGEGKISANRGSCNGWQKFYIQQLKEQNCAIKTLSGFYLSSDKNGIISANSKVINQQSIFGFAKTKDGSVAFRDFRYQYLSIPTLIRSKDLQSQ